MCPGMHLPPTQTHINEHMYTSAHTIHIYTGPKKIKLGKISLGLSWLTSLELLCDQIVTFRHLILTWGIMFPFSCL